MVIVMTPRQKRVKEFCQVFTDTEKRPYDLALGQLEIIEAIVFREGATQKNRVQVIASTQYGKSIAVAFGVILRTYFYGEKWGIVAPSDAKAKIIMSYIIQHIFDSQRFVRELEIGEPLERLKRERSKNKLTFANGAEIVTFSADSRNRQRVKEALVGFGSPNLIIDESSLVPDDLYATAKRMVGGTKDNFMLEIGNPWERHHFYRTWHSELYDKIFIDYKRALSEGRYSESFVEEMRGERFFDILYECNFPSEDAISDTGWKRIVTDDDLSNCNQYANENWDSRRGTPRLGVDIARGGNNATVFTVRFDNVAKVLQANHDADLMAQVPRIEQYMDEFSIDASNVYIDDVGVGGGVVNRLQEKGHAVTPVNEGARAIEKDKYTNIRSEQFWLMGDWLKKNGKLIEHEGWNELRNINYKQDSSGRLKIEPKADMAKRGVPSPDYADSLMLTFNNRATITEADFLFL